MPITSSQSPVAPLISLDLTAASILLPAQQRAGDRVPFDVQRTGRHRPARFLVPPARVRQIAFATMQIGMDPGAVTILMRHHNIMGALPVVLAGPPERLQRGRKP